MFLSGLIRGGANVALSAGWARLDAGWEGELNRRCDVGIPKTVDLTTLSLPTTLKPVHMFFYEENLILEQLAGKGTLEVRAIKREMSRTGQGPAWMELRMVFQHLKVNVPPVS